MATRVLLARVPKEKEHDFLISFFVYFLSFTPYFPIYLEPTYSGIS